MNTSFLQWLESGLILGILAYISVLDLRQRRIPNGSLILMLAVRAVLLAAGGQARELLMSAGAALVLLGMVLLTLPWHSGRIGGGDTKLLVVTVFCCGVDRAGKFLAVLAVLLALTHIQRRIRGRKVGRIPFAPYVLAAMALIWMT